MQYFVSQIFFQQALPVWFEAEKVGKVGLLGKKIGEKQDFRVRKSVVKKCLI